VWSSRDDTVFETISGAPDDDVAVAEGVRGGTGRAAAAFRRMSLPLAVMQWRRNLLNETATAIVALLHARGDA